MTLVWNIENEQGPATKQAVTCFQSWLSEMLGLYSAPSVLQLWAWKHLGQGTVGALRGLKILFA